MKMPKSNILLAFKLEKDPLTPLMFVLVSFGYPLTHNYVFPLILLIGIIQFYRALSKKISLPYLLESHFYLLIFSLIFYRSIHTSFLVLNLIFYGYNFLRQKNRQYKCSLRPEILTVIFFVLIFFNQFFFQFSFKSIDTYLHLMFYPILFYFIKASKSKIDVTKAMLFYLLSVFIASISLMFINAWEGTLKFNSNTFFAQPLGLTHVYFGLFLGVAISLIFVLLENKKELKIKWPLSLMVLFLSLIIYVGARMALIGIMLIALIFLVKNIKQPTLLKAILLMFLFVALLTVSYYKIPRVKAGIYHISKVYESVTSDNKKDLIQNSWRNMYQRFLVTKYTLQEIQKNIFFGIGMQNVKQRLFDKIRKDGYLYYQPINPHNQYLHIWLGMGIFSLLFFLYMLYSFIKDQPVGLYFTLFFLIIMLSESVLVREKGISLFFLFTLTFLIDKKIAWLK